MKSSCRTTTPRRRQHQQLRPQPQPQPQPQSLYRIRTTSSKLQEPLKFFLLVFLFCGNISFAFSIPAFSKSSSSTSSTTTTAAAAAAFGLTSAAVATRVHSQPTQQSSCAATAKSSTGSSSSSTSSSSTALDALPNHHNHHNEIDSSNSDHYNNHHNNNNRMRQIRARMNRVVMAASSKSNNENNDENNANNNNNIGKLEELKQREAELSALLAEVRREKLSQLRSRPLTIGVIGFGRFGQFIAKTFAKHGNVIVTSRSDYTEIAQGMGVTYVPLSDPQAFLEYDLDVIVVATSILSFKSTIQMLAPHIQKKLQENNNRKVAAAGDNHNNNNNGAAAAGAGGAVLQRGPLVVDVLSVKEHPRSIMLEYLPEECDILCTHPMFGPDSGKDGWYNLNFVYEKTRIDKVILDSSSKRRKLRHMSFDSVLSEDTATAGKSVNAVTGMKNRTNDDDMEAFVDERGTYHSVHEDSEAHAEGMDRMERFLSIWEEEGCRMVQLSCREHDAYAANSQFITHLVGRVLGSQGLAPTPIDTSGFQSVLKLVENTEADSFDLFYGLYKYNQNSVDTIKQLQAAMNDVVSNLQAKENEDAGDGNEKNDVPQQQQQQQQESKIAAEVHTLQQDSSQAPNLLA